MITKFTNISLPEDLWEKANILAIKKRISFSEYVRQALINQVSGKFIDIIEIDENGKVSPPEAEKFIVGLNSIR